MLTNTDNFTVLAQRLPLIFENYVLLIDLDVYVWGYNGVSSHVSIL